MMPQIPHHRFRSLQPNALVQTGPRLLTINVLPTYPNFETFRDLILFVLKQYRDLAEAGNPVKVGLRYINHIASSSVGRQLGDYLNYALSYPGQLTQPARETAARLVLPYGRLGTLGIAVAFPARTASGELGALLDLEFSWGEPNEFNLDEFPSWLEEAHQVIYSAFISSVPDHIMREMRGAER